MNEAVKDMIGKRVQVWSNAGDTFFTDDGILETFADPFIRLRTFDGETLCLSVHCVRLVKLVEG